MSVTTDEADGYPKPAYAWYTVGVLTIAYVFSFADRYILGLLVEPIKADLGLTDFQFSLLLGPAFAIFYATMGLPLGWLADRRRRTWIVSAGIAVWSVATALSGLARNFAQLFAARLSIGVGEATLSPCALSMISDSFPRARRARALAVYLTALSFGSGIAYLVGGQVIAWSTSVEQITLPLIGNVRPWQLTFILIGLPGLLVAVLMFFLREPSRKERSIEVGHASLADTFKYIIKRRRAYVAIFAIASTMTILAYSHQFAAALFSRTWGWDAVTFSLYNGIGILILGPPSNFFAGWYIDYLYAKGHENAPLLVMTFGVCVLVPFGILFSLMPTGGTGFAVFLFSVIGVASVTTAGPAALLSITPGEIRSQTIAIYYMVISLTGLLIGPTGVAFFTDFVFGDDNMIHYSMAALAAVIGLPLLAALPFLRRMYISEMQNKTDPPG